MVIFIKYMVSLRCKLKVKAELEDLDLLYSDIESGVVELNDDITDTERKELKAKLHKSGMELLDDKNSIVIEELITTITTMIYSSDELPKVVFAEYLSEKLDFDYVALSTIFSEVKGITIEQFIIIHKIERVKELLLYDELNLKQIANKLNYKNLPLLSTEFKKVTGLTLEFYKQLKQKKQIRPKNKKS